MVDWNGLAEMAPVLAAGFTGKPEILQNTMQAQQLGKKNRDDQALRSFGRELFSLGHPADEMELKSLAAKYNIDPLTAMALIKKKNEENQANRMMQLKEGEATQNREEFDWKKKYEEDKLTRQGVDDVRQSLIKGAEQDYKDETLAETIRHNKEVEARGGQERSPYHTPIVGADGVFPFNNRTGEVGAPLMYGGKPIIQAQADPTLKGRIAGAEKTAGEMGKAIVIEMGDATKAVQNLKILQNVEPLMEQAFISGFGADSLLTVGKALQRFGVNYFDDGIKNTEAFFAQMGRQVGQVIKDFGSGTGLSDADREYAEKIAGGQIKLSEQSLKEIIRLNKISMTNLVNNYNIKAEQAMNKPGAESFPYDLRVPLPGAQTQQPRSQLDATQPGKAKQLTDKAKVAEYLKRAGGDPRKAEALARQDGWSF